MLVARRRLPPAVFFWATGKKKPAQYVVAGVTYWRVILRAIVDLLIDAKSISMLS